MTESKDLNLIWYDKREYKIPLTSNNWWFKDKYRGASHCVLMCNNDSQAFYFTEKGKAKIAYCLAHAEKRILETMLTGRLERGIWCMIDQRRMRPHEDYKRYMPYLKKHNPKQAKKLEEKINMIKKLVINIRGEKHGKK